MRRGLRSGTLVQAIFEAPPNHADEGRTTPFERWSARAQIEFLGKKAPGPASEGRPGALELQVALNAERPAEARALRSGVRVVAFSWLLPGKRAFLDPVEFTFAVNVV